MFTTRMILLLTLSLLGACAGSPPASTRYLLPGDSGAAAAGNASTTYTLVVQSLQLADYLNAEGIVLQMDDIILNEAAGHRWAEALGPQLQRSLRQRLANRLPDTRVMDDPARTTDALELRVEVERFHGRYDGVAIASGQWQLRDNSGQLLTQETFSVQTTLDDDGYPALVRALGRSWDQVAAEIAGRVTMFRGE